MPRKVGKQSINIEILKYCASFDSTLILIFDSITQFFKILSFMTEPSTILVVEDNDFVRMQIVKYLQGANHNVVEAADGKAGLDAIASNDIALCLVDVRMEPVDGFEFIKSIRGMDIQVPVILAVERSLKMVKRKAHL